MSGKSKQPKSFEEAIRTLFGDPYVHDYVEHPEKSSLRFCLTSGYEGSVTLDRLTELSTLLGTRRINFKSPYVASQGCESCGHGFETHLPVEVSEVVFYPCQFDLDGKRLCGKQATNRTLHFCDEHAPLRCACGRQASRSSMMFNTFGSEQGPLIRCSTCE